MGNGEGAMGMVVEGAIGVVEGAEMVGGRCEGGRWEVRRWKVRRWKVRRWKVRRWEVEGTRLVAMRRTVVELATEVTLGGHLQGVAPRAIAIHEDVPVVILLEAEEGASLAAGRARRACGV